MTNTKGATCPPFSRQPRMRCARRVLQCKRGGTERRPIESMTTVGGLGKLAEGAARTVKAGQAVPQCAPMMTPAPRSIRLAATARAAHTLRVTTKLCANKGRRPVGQDFPRSPPGRKAGFKRCDPTSLCQDGRWQVLDFISPLQA